MSKIKYSRWWNYFVGLLLGSLIFVGLIPSCAARSSFDVFTPVKENEAQEPQELIFSQTKSLADIVANLPTAEEIRAMPLAPHPRLLASQARFAEIRRQIETDQSTREWYDKLHHHADTLLQEKLPEYKLPDGKRLLKTIHSSIPTLALVYQIEKDRRYLNRVWQELEAAGKFSDWNPAHFLDTAEMTYAFAIGYDWLYQDLNEQQRTLISSTIVRLGLKPAIAEYQSAAKWTAAEHNWNQVCNGGIGTGALAILDRYPELASQTLYEALQRLPKVMQHYAPDGAWKEGVGYWHYGTFYNTIILAALNTSLNTDFDLSQIAGFAQTGLFPIYTNGATNIPFNFADGDDKFIRAPEMFWMSQKYNKPEYSLYQQKSPVHSALDLIWYRPLTKHQTLSELPRDRYFRGVEVVSMRSDWENPDGIFVGFKAGDNKATHSNLDLGTFVIDALGVRWATELGRDDYNLPGYFDQQKQRWTYYKTRAEGQNTLVIDPSKSPDQNPQAQSKIVRFQSKSQEVSATADLTPAYYPEVSKVLRKISLQKQRKQILIQDEIKTNEPVNLFWFMHTKAKIQIGRDGKTAMLYQDGKRLWVKLLNSKPNYQFTVMNAQALPSSPNPRGQEDESMIKKLTIKLENVTNKKFSVLLVPLNEE
jgi:hypothetical protein